MEQVDILHFANHSLVQVIEEITKEATPEGISPDEFILELYDGDKWPYIVNLLSGSPLESVVMFSYVYSQKETRDVPTKTICAEFKDRFICRLSETTSSNIYNRFQGLLIKFYQGA